MKTNPYNKYNEKRYSIKMPTDGVDKTRIDFIVNNIPDSKLEILDIGCWDGSYAIRYKKTTNKVYGIESSLSSVKKAIKKGIYAHHGDFMEDIFFSKDKFDIIVAGEVIEHIFDTDMFLTKIRRLLKKNGILILTTPNVASLPRRILLFLGINPILENRTLINESAGHIRYFTFSDMRRLLKDNKFEILVEKSDVLNFNNVGNLYTTLIPKINKKLGRSILVIAKKM
jgi:2-polyprenyl-3-methyl-5-hydroxy-6-metoxy-1,4-benzoquinol methylase